MQEAISLRCDDYEFEDRGLARSKVASADDEHGDAGMAHNETLAALEQLRDEVERVAAPAEQLGATRPPALKKRKVTLEVEPAAPAAASTGPAAASTGPAAMTAAAPAAASTGPAVELAAAPSTSPAANEVQLPLGLKIAPKCKAEPSASSALSASALPLSARPVPPWRAARAVPPDAAVPLEEPMAVQTQCVAWWVEQLTQQGVEVTPFMAQNLNGVVERDSAAALAMIGRVLAELRSGHVNRPSNYFKHSLTDIRKRLGLWV